jgi:hypothetical protein
MTVVRLHSPWGTLQGLFGCLLWRLWRREERMRTGKFNELCFLSVCQYDKVLTVLIAFHHKQAHSDFTTKWISVWTNIWGRSQCSLFTQNKVFNSPAIHMHLNERYLEVSIETRGYWSVGPSYNFKEYFSVFYFSLFVDIGMEVPVCLFVCFSF